MTDWREASEEMRTALREVVAPELRSRGFKGSFPHFARNNANRIDLLTFQFSQFGPDLYIEVGSCPLDAPGAEVVPLEKRRIHHAGLCRRRIGPQPSFSFEGAVAASGTLAAQVANIIEGEGEPWWANPQGILPPNKSLERTRDR